MMQRHQKTEPASATARVVERNIRALLDKREAEQRALGWQEKIAERITRFSGSMPFVYLHALGVTLWVTINLGWLPFIPKFDPTFVVLAMAASVEAIFLSTFILITQNRMMAAAEKRAELNLQISLLAEHEITRIIQLNRRICERLGLQVEDAELRELSRDVRPEQVLETMERHEASRHDESHGQP